MNFYSNGVQAAIFLMQVPEFVAADEVEESDLSDTETCLFKEYVLQVMRKKKSVRKNTKQRTVALRLEFFLSASVPSGHRQL